MDKIILEEIEVQSRIGLLPEEQNDTQLLKVSLEIFIDLSVIGKSDDINDGIDYCHIIDRTNEFARNSDYGTIEAWAHYLAEYLKEISERIQKLGITVEKPRYANELRTKAIKVYVER